MKAKYILLFFILLFYKLSYEQVIIDSCFTSVTPLSESDFSSSSTLANVYSSDVLEWNGSSWFGGYSGANITIPPPSNAPGSRAIFIGNSSSWTTGGETFGLKLSAPLVSGVNYSFSFTYVSTGTGSTGSFSPFFRTNSTPSMGGAVLVGNLPTVGYSWTSNTISFTATAAQAGHTWLIIGTQPNGTSGLINAISDNCNAIIPCDFDFGNDTTLCPGETLILDATTSGATYLWQDNSTNPTFTVTQPGTYWVKIYESCGVASDTIIVNYNPAPTVGAGTAQSVCNGTAVTLTANNPDAATIIWDNGVNDGQSFTPTSTGTYTVTADLNGCTSTDNVIITVNPLPTFTTSTTDPSCGNSDGEIVIIPGSGNTITSYSIDNGATTQAGATFSNLSGGTYNIIITDANGCEATGTTSLTNAGTVGDASFTLTDFCEGTANSANITGTNGGTFTIVSPTGGAATINPTTGEITDGVGGTTYTVQYETSGTCPTTSTQDVTVNPSPTFTTSKTDPTCGNNNGEIVITPGSGGSITSYSIDNGATSQAGGTFSNLGGGSYTIVITDVNGCKGTGTESLSNATGLTTSVVTSADISCFGANDGSAEVSATGGSGSYTYNWSPTGGTAATATGLAPGNYTVTVTDGGGCSDDVQITINEPNEITINKTITPSDCGQDNGAILLTVTGGSGGYTYSWNPNVSTSNQATDLPFGAYEVIVTDGNGCNKTVSYNVGVGNSFYIEAVPDSVTILQGASVPMHLFVDPNITIDTIVWTPSGGLSCTNCKDPIATPNNSTTYIVTVVDENGCTATDTVKINVILPCADIFVPNTFSPNKDGLNDLQCVLGECIVSLDFTIFNRWGEAVFHTGEQKECWDGTFRGKPVQSGVYIYKLKATLEDGSTFEKSGNVTLVR